MEQTEENKPQYSAPETAATPMPERPGVSAARRRRKGAAWWSKLLLLLLLNLVFVVGAVELLLRYRLEDGALRSVEQVRVVEEESQVISVASAASPAVVSIIATAQVPQYETQYQQFFNFRIPSRVPSGTVEQQVGAGSGFLVSADGYIVTNKHVVEDEDATYTVILNDEQHKNEKAEARVVARDPNPDKDIAILKIEKTGLPFLNLGDSGSLKVGQTAVAIGYALGEFNNTVSRGVVSGLNRSVSMSDSSGRTETLDGLIQTDAAVNPGNSGGPLLDINGQVIGVNVGMADAQSIGFAIPINDVKAAYEQVKATGGISKEAAAFLGVRYLPIDTDLQRTEQLPYGYGAIILRGETMSELAVTPGSPADKAGLAENDIILEVDGVKVDEENTLAQSVGKHKPGDTIKLKLYHRGEEKEVSVTLGQSQ